MDPLIFTECSAGTGLGHLTRCFAVYDALRMEGKDPLLVVNSDLKEIGAILSGKKYTLQEWTGRKYEADFSALKGKVAVVDSYRASKHCCAKIASFSKAAFFFDDFKRIHYPEQGIMINASVLAHELNYPVSAGKKHLLGMEYVPLKKEFWEKEDKAISGSIEEIGITAGGEDIHNLTSQILKMLVLNFPLMRKKIIVGPAFHNKEEIEKAADGMCELILFPGAEKMREVMTHADVFICACGQTIFELAAMGTPMIGFMTAENQRDNFRGLEKLGFLAGAGNWNDDLLLENIKKSVVHLESASVRKEISDKASSLVDGKGAFRIAKKIMEEMT